MQSIGKELSTTEINQFTSVLSTNFETEYSYIEMISLLFGVEVMGQTLSRYNIKQNVGEIGKVKSKPNTRNFTLRDAFKD